MRKVRLLLASHAGFAFFCACSACPSARAQSAAATEPSSPTAAPLASTDAPSRRVMTLAQAEQLALEQQPQVLVARAATSIAQAQADEARAPMLPQVFAMAGYTRETANATSVQSALQARTNGGIRTSWTSYDVWNVGLSATQLIYDFGQTWERLHSANLTVDAQRASEQVARLGVLLNVRKAYFGARAAKELTVVAKETLDGQNKHLAQVQGMVQVGTQPPIALAQQRAAVANAVVQVITSQNNYETAKAQLNQATGVAGGTEYDVGDDAMPAVEDEDQPLDALAAKGLATRPEMVLLRRQREAQEATLSSFRGAYGPTISASAAATDVGVQLDQLVPNWSAGIAVVWPIFQGGLTSGQVRQAQAVLQSVDAQRSLEELQVRLDVDSARLAVRAAKATIGAVDDALASAREQLRLAEQRYATGVGSIIELNDAQVAFTGAAAQVVQARYNLATARALLLAAIGRT